MKLNGTKTLETKQLILRKYVIEDSPSFFRNVMSDEKVFEYFAFGPHQSEVETEREVKGYLADYEDEKTYLWAITEKDNSEVIGKIAIDDSYLIFMQTCEVGYMIGSKWWGKGYATEALTAVINYLFEEEVYLIEAKYSSQNLASGKVLVKAGMIKEAVLVDRRMDKETGRRYDLIIYSIRNPQLIEDRKEVSQEVDHYFTEFMKEYEYPKKAQEELKHYYIQLLQSESWSDFQRLVLAYEENKDNFNQEAVEQLQQIANESSVPEYSVNLIYLISISKSLQKRYEDTRWSQQMFHDAMMDLKYKLQECHQMYDIWGNFVIWWEIGFFDLSRVALGRLQFEIIECLADFWKDGFRIKKGDPIINLHIPSSGPLLEKDCFQSYKAAAQFYKKYFPGKAIWFMCSSWLLYPQNMKMLPENSNIVTFMKKFDIIACQVDEQKEDLWRVFYKESLKPVDELPRATGLQRAYADWLQAGKSLGVGQGIFYLKKEEI
jgi:RimJ/RimL family protein N-acetyltransferase